MRDRRSLEPLVAERQRERERETALRSALFLTSFLLLPHAAPREKKNEVRSALGAVVVVVMTNGAYLFQLFGMKIFLFCVPEPTLSHMSVCGHKKFLGFLSPPFWWRRNEGMPEDSMRGSFFWTRISLAFLVVAKRLLRLKKHSKISRRKKEFFFHTCAHFQSSRAHRRGTRLVAAPPKKKEEEEEEETDPDGPRTKTTTTTTAAAAMRDIKALKIRSCCRRKKTKGTIWEALWSFLYAPRRQL